MALEYCASELCIPQQYDFTKSVSIDCHSGVQTTSPSYHSEDVTHVPGLFIIRLLLHFNKPRHIEHRNLAALLILGHSMRVLEPLPI